MKRRVSKSPREYYFFSLSPKAVGISNPPECLAESYPTRPWAVTRGARLPTCLAFGPALGAAHRFVRQTSELPCRRGRAGFVEPLSELCERR
jgi:hypothetical protein